MSGVSLIFILGSILSITLGLQEVWLTKALEQKQFQEDILFMEHNEIDSYLYKNSVDLQLYYECHCPYSIDFEIKQLKNVVNDLNNYVNIKTYPYGNAETIETDGKVKFECQHGPKECYGNKLHACALKHISNHTEALLFNICMMETNDNTKGSDDAAAARCSKEMNINSSLILECAKGEEGDQLLKYYGEESKKANFGGVPYVLLNGAQWEGGDLKRDICTKLSNPPESCRQ